MGVILAAQKRVNNRDRNKNHFLCFNGMHEYMLKSRFLTFLLLFKSVPRVCFGGKYSKHVGEMNKNDRNSNKRLITYLNRTARAKHIKSLGKTPKPVKTIRQMYLENKNK